MITTWSVAIFTSRETSATISATLDAAISACVSCQTTIDLIVNGNPELAGAVLDRMRATARVPGPADVRLRVWHLALADKAYAWNTYLQAIFPASDLAFFIDGYARVKPESLAVIADRLAQTPHAWSGTGVPSAGRNAAAHRQRMIDRQGGIHGNLYAVRGTIMRTFRASGFHFPLGLYRSDPLLAAALAVSLDPKNNPWDWTRLAVCPEATWSITPLSPWRWNDLYTHWRRLRRQAQGSLENLAIREHIAVRKELPEHLPKTTAELVGAWLQAFPDRARRLYISNPLCWLAARNVLRPRDWSLADLPPEQVGEIVFARAAGQGPVRSTDAEPDTSALTA